MMLVEVLKTGVGALALGLYAIHPGCAVSAIERAQAAATPRPPGMILTSAAFSDGGAIPTRHSAADPALVSPKLQWTNVPPDTLSFVLMVYDPDVVRQKSISDVLHWLVFNIPGSARELPENMPGAAQLGDGTVQARNDKGVPGFLGPGAGAQGPPHHYTFLLFALDTKLALGPDATRADVQSAMDGHMLGKAVLVGRYQRAAAPN